MISEITLNLNSALLAEAKALAVQQRTTLARLIEDGLRLRLHTQETPAKPVRLPVYRGKGGLMPGVDGLSNKVVLETVERDSLITERLNALYAQAAQEPVDSSLAVAQLRAVHYEAW